MVKEVDPRIAAQEAAEARRADQAAGITPQMQLALDYESAPAWVPSEDGAIITGKVVAILKASIENQYGFQEYPKVIVQTDSGSLYAIHALGTVIFGAFKRLRTKVGDRIVIKNNGETRSKDGNTYRNLTILDDAYAATIQSGGNWQWDDAPERRRTAKSRTDDEPPY